MFALLVQQKSSDITCKKDEQNWKAKVCTLYRALTRILKMGVPEPTLPKSGRPIIQKNIASFEN